MAEKAVELAPDQPAGYVARGALRYTFARNWSGAKADYEKALSLDPSDADVQRGYGSLLSSVGRLLAAITATKQAIELDPLSAGAWSNLGYMLAERGDFQAAHDAFLRALEIFPGHELTINLALLQLIESHPAETLTTIRQADEGPLRLLCVAAAEHMLETIRHHNERWIS